jgi:ABC-type antimicrobial peptide transport system permease subunit
VVHKQVNFIGTKHLGYNKDNVILFKKEGNLNDKLESFLNEIKTIPGVVNASNMATELTGNRTGTSVSWEGKNPDDKTSFKYIHVNYDFVETMGIEMKEGRSFSREYGSDSTKIIFNEAAITAMGLTNPIGQTINQWGEDKQIIGVARNFHFESLYEPLKPCFFILNEHGGNIIVRIKAGSERETLQKVGAYYKQFNEGMDFEYTFLDEKFGALYVAEQRVAALSTYFAAIAVLISCLGLFGLATFTAERRRKEIGIRKVLGSSELAIVGLLSAEFTRLVLISILIALPLSYLLTSAWLSNFAFSIGLAWWYFAGAGLLALLIAWLTVGSQAMKAAKANPIQTLREE